MTENKQYTMIHFIDSIITDHNSNGTFRAHYATLSVSWPHNRGFIDPGLQAKGNRRALPNSQRSTAMQTLALYNTRALANARPRVTFTRLVLEEPISPAVAARLAGGAPAPLEPWLALWLGSPLGRLQAMVVAVRRSREQ